MNLQDRLELNDIIESPRRFIEEFCYIITKDGTFEKFKLNSSQSKIMDVVEKNLMEKKPIRIVVLKARQAGISTLASALGFWWSAMHENSSYAVVAHKESSASSIFEKNKIFYNNLPKPMQPQTSRFSSECIYFDDNGIGGLKSKIFFGTAGGGELFRGQTVLFMHKSEYAFWDDDKGILEKSLNACIPLKPFSAIIVESTANGFNRFKKLWDNASRGDDRWNGYTPIFIGWQDIEEYKMTPPTDFVIEEDEWKLMVDIDATIEQIAWRRFKIMSDFDGDVDMFKQEYPSTPEEAFLTSGRSVFSQEVIKKGYQNSTKYIKTRQIESFPTKETLHIWEEPKICNEDVHFKNSIWNDEKQRYELVDTELVVETISYMDNYTIGVDTSGLGADFNRIVVVNNTTHKQVACWGKENINEENLAKIVVEIATYYNNGMIAIEVNFSHAIYDYIISLGYENLYFTESIQRSDKIVSSSYGWVTTKSTKPAIISNLRAMLNRNPTIIPDKEFWQEAEYYTMEDSSRNIMNAESGHHDDIIMATAIAMYVSISSQSNQGRTIVKDQNTIRESHSFLLPQKSKKSYKLERNIYENNA